MRGFRAIEREGEAGEGIVTSVANSGPTRAAGLETIASYDVHAIALDTAATWPAPASELL